MAEIHAHTPSDGDLPFRSFVLPILFLSSLFLLTFIARIIPAPLMPSIEADLGISHAQAGSMFLIISFGYFVAILGSGFVSARISHRNTIAFSAVSVGLALVITAFSTNLWAIRLGLLLIGLASGLYLPSGLSTVTSLVSPRDWGKAISIHELAPNASLVAAPLLAELLLLVLPWRGVFLLIGLVSLALGCAFFRFGRGGDFPGQAPSFAALGILMRESSFWIMLILYCLGIGVALGVYTMLPLYLVSEHDIGRSLANTYVSLSRVSCIPMVFVGGWANDRFGPKRSLGVILGLSGLLLVLLGSVGGSGIILVVFLQPLVAACFFPPAVAVVSSIGPRHIRNVSISLTIPLAFLVGGGLIPTVIGYVGEAGSFGLGISMVGVLTLLGAVLSQFLRIEISREQGA